MLKSLGQVPTEEELEEMLRNADQDGNGEIDFPEFLELMSAQLGSNQPDQEIEGELVKES